MKGFDFRNAPTIYMELGQTSLNALNGDEGLEIPLERLPNGRLTDACKQNVAARLQGFLKRKSWPPRMRALCAIGARGVSLRRLTLPAAGRDEFERLLMMQVESEFPLPPDELAWGWRLVGESRDNGVTKRELLAVAVKKEVVEEYASLFAKCQISPLFTLAALARSYVCPRPSGAYAILDLGREHSELILFDGGIPTAVRVVAWGQKSALTDFEALAKSIQNSLAGRKVFLSGHDARLGDLPRRLTEAMNGAVELLPLMVGAGEGRSSAILGMKRSVEEGGGGLVLLESRKAGDHAAAARPAPLKLAVLAAVLALGLLALPYAEAILLKPFLSRKLAVIQSESGRLAMIDREFDFLQYLKENQPPYLDAIYLFSKSAAAGARIDSLTMNREGQVSLRGSMRNSDQVSDFRSKLIDSGFFSNVVVEEQSPTPDRQKVNVRITALWKSPGERQLLAIGPTAEEIEKAKHSKELEAGPMPPGMPPGMMMPGGMPPGVVIHGMPPGVTIPVEAIRTGVMPANLPPGVRMRLSGGRMELPPGVQPPTNHVSR